MEAVLSKKFTRRAFGQTLGLGLSSITLLGMLGSVGSTIGCTFGSVAKAVEEYVGVGLQGFEAIINILTGAGVIPLPLAGTIQLVVSLVKAGFADILKAVADYNAAPSDQKQTYLGKLSTVLTIVVADIQQFWNDLQIPDAKLAALIQGLLGVIVGTLQGFVAKLPAPTSTEAISKAAGLPRHVLFSAKVRSAKAFKQEFNGLLNNAGMGQYSIR